MINTIASLWREKIYICPCENNLFLEAHSFYRALLSKTVHILELIMSADKYSLLFWR